MAKGWGPVDPPELEGSELATGSWPSAQPSTPSVSHRYHRSPIDADGQPSTPLVGHRYHRSAVTFGEVSTEGKRTSEGAPRASRSQPRGPKLLQGRSRYKKGEVSQEASGGFSRCKG